MKTKIIELNVNECADILVGLCEFADIINQKESTFGNFKKTNDELIMRFRKLSWEFVDAREKTDWTK